MESLTKLIHTPEGELKEDLPYDLPIGTRIRYKDHNGDWKEGIVTNHALAYARKCYVGSSKLVFIKEQAIFADWTGNGFASWMPKDKVEVLVDGNWIKA